MNNIYDGGSPTRQTNLQLSARSTPQYSDPDGKARTIQ